MKRCLILISFVLMNLHGKSQSCKRAPEFMRDMGFDANSSALISTDRRTRGVLLVEYSNIQHPNQGYSKKYQHPSWDDAGFVSSITLDSRGNAYVLPSAMVNTIHNPPEGQNTVHQIKSEDGVMKPFVRLPMDDKPHMGNAYGLMSSFLDCTTNSLIVSTIAGSTREEEHGCIYAINLENKKFTRILSDVDAMGVAVVEKSGQRYLIYGSARHCSVWSVAIDNVFRPIGKPIQIADLTNIGPRGDDKARKISVNAQGDLIIKGVPFYYNLTAPVYLPSTQFVLTYDINNRKWRMKNP